MVIESRSVEEQSSNERTKRLTKMVFSLRDSAFPTFQTGSSFYANPGHLNNDILEVDTSENRITASRPRNLQDAISLAEMYERELGEHWTVEKDYDESLMLPTPNI